MTRRRPEPALPPGVSKWPARMTRKQRLFVAVMLILLLVLLGAPAPVWWAVMIPLAIVEAIYWKRQRIAANG